METLLTHTASRIALGASGLFFMAGLLTGVWKFRCMKSHPKAEAPNYVNIAHRSALMYAFAAQLLAVFAALSVFASIVNITAVAVLLFFFAISILNYVRLGLTTTTDNCLRDSPNPAKDHAILNVLSVAEIGGFGILLVGACIRLAV